MRILFNMLPEPGHLYPAVPLAEALRKRGHEVLFASILDLEPLVASRGFPFIALHRREAPRGILADIEREPFDGVGLPRAIALQIRIVQDMLGENVEQTLDEIDPSIVLTDVVAPHIALVAHRLGIPAAGLSTSLSQRLDELPPITSPLPMNASQVTLELARMRASCGVNKREWGFLDRLMDRCVARFGYPSDRISFRSTFWPQFTLFPEYVLAPSAIDLPRRGPDRPTFVAAALDLDRREEVSPEVASFCASDSPLLYASLGSQAFRYQHAERFFRAVTGAMRARPEWRALLVAGDRFADSPIFDEKIPNLLVLRRAPQLWALRRAAIFITHGGLGGVREAIAARIPMIVVPQAYDQFGNATRVVHHGLGTCVPAQVVSSEGLVLRVDTMLRERATYVERLTALDRACREEEDSNRGVDVVERLVATGAAHARRHAPPIAARPTRERASSGWMFLNKDGQLARGAPGRLTRGAKLEWPGAAPLSLGVVGFVVSHELSGALAHADGPLLARVELLGTDVVREESFTIARGLRCAWTLDVEDVLYEFARWCVDRYLEHDARTSPETVDACIAAMDEYRELRATGASVTELSAKREAIYETIGTYFERGSFPVWTAMLANGNEAAGRSRATLIHELAMRDVGRAAGTADGADSYRAAHVASAVLVDSELTRRVNARISHEGLCLDASTD